jgi:DNA polymerase
MQTILPSHFQKSLAAAFSAHQDITLELLKKQYAGCTLCPLATQGRTQVVFGSGASNASLMLIGEAPGHDEDAKGMPFVGRSGKLLRSILDDCGFSPHDIFISNTTKCRPPANRPPTIEEKTICSQAILVKEIAAIRPRIICTVGATATTTFLDTNKTISSLRGQILQTEYFAIMPTYHPSYLLRNRAAIETVKNDFLRIKSFLVANP